MLLDKLSPEYAPYAVDGLPMLYGAGGFWETALPMPQTSTLWHSLVALPHPGRGYPSFAEPGEVPVSFDNDDGGDCPDPIMLETARWLIENDEEVERAIIDTVLSDMPELRNIQNGIVLGDEDKPLPATCDEPMLRQMIRLLHLTLPPVKGQLPYFGAELACTWDREHGYGIMFHGTNVVRSGGGDIPNLSWIADYHADGRIL